MGSIGRTNKRDTAGTECGPPGQSRDPGEPRSYPKKGPQPMEQAGKNGTARRPCGCYPEFTRDRNTFGCICYPSSKGPGRAGHKRAQGNRNFAVVCYSGMGTNGGKGPGSGGTNQHLEFSEKLFKVALANRQKMPGGTPKVRRVSFFYPPSRHTTSPLRSKK